MRIGFCFKGVGRGRARVCSGIGVIFIVVVYVVFDLVFVGFSLEVIVEYKRGSFLEISSLSRGRFDGVGICGVLIEVGFGEEEEELVFVF